MTFGWVDDFTQRTVYVKLKVHCQICGKELSKFTGDTQNNVCFECLQKLSENSVVDASAYKYLEYFRFLKNLFFERGYSEKQTTKKAFKIAKESAKLRILSR